MGGLFEVASPSAPAFPSVPMTNAAVGFQALVRTSILALEMLPSPSSNGGGVVVVTDGCIAASDLDASEALVSQLRSRKFSLSFVEVCPKRMPENGPAGRGGRLGRGRRVPGRSPNYPVLEYFAQCTQGAVDTGVRLVHFLTKFCWPHF